jgi:hypothetical protein
MVVRSVLKLVGFDKLHLFYPVSLVLCRFVPGTPSSRNSCCAQVHPGGAPALPSNACDIVTTGLEL